MLKYVQDQANSGHRMAVVTWTDQLRVLQQFTSDPQVLMTAIRNLRPQEQPLPPGAPPPESRLTGVGGAGGGAGGAASGIVATAQQAVADFQNMQVGYDQER